MSWFKKIFGSQYGFNSQSSSQGSSQGSSQEPKVHYVKDKTETDGNEIEIENLTVNEIQECDDATQSTQDSCFSWSGVSEEIDIKVEKRELSDDEEEPWWESFKPQSTQKSAQESSQLKVFSSSQLVVCNLKQRLVHHKMTIKVTTKRKKTKTRKLVFTQSWENLKNIKTCNSYFRNKKNELCKYKSNQ